MAGDNKPKPLFPTTPESHSEERVPASPAVLHFDQPQEQQMCDRCGKPRLARQSESQCDCTYDQTRERIKARRGPLFTPTDVVPTESVPTGPTILNIPGMKIRKRLEISLEDLRTLNPDVTSPIFDQARAALLVVNLEDATTAQFLQAGLATQEKFVVTSSKMLALTTNPQLDAVDQGLREIGALMSATELDKLFSGHSGWKSWFESAPSFEEAKLALKDKINRVQDRSNSLREDIPKLEVLKVEGDVIVQQLEELNTELDIDLVVARFLISHLKASPEKDFYEEWADALQRRADSMLMTRITARQAGLQLKIIKQHLRRLSEVVQTALVNLIPAWCGSCVGFLSSVRQSQVTDNDKLRSLTTLRDDILKLITETEN